MRIGERLRALARKIRLLARVARAHRREEIFPRLARLEMRRALWARYPRCGGKMSRKPLKSPHRAGKGRPLQCDDLRESWSPMR